LTGAYAPVAPPWIRPWLYIWVKMLLKQFWENPRSILLPRSVSDNIWHNTLFYKSMLTYFSNAPPPPHTHTQEGGIQWRPWFDNSTIIPMANCRNHCGTRMDKEPRNWRQKMLLGETMSIMFADGAEAPSANIMDMVSPYATDFALWNFRCAGQIEELHRPSPNLFSVCDPFFLVFPFNYYTLHRGGFSLKSDWCETSKIA